MAARDLVYGLLNRPGTIPDPRVASACRDWTITWSRYDYHGPIIEDATVDGVLARARREGFRSCFILAPGQIVRERWAPDRDRHATFLQALGDVLPAGDAMAAGCIETSPGAWYGLRGGGLLVDLERHEAWGAPPFGEPETAPRSLPSTAEERRDGAIASLRPLDGVHRAVPRLPGWRFVEASLRHGVPVSALPEPLAGHLLDLDAASPAGGAALQRVIEGGFDAFDGCRHGLTPDQAAFLDTVRTQSDNARRGVFLLNIEAYADVETPPAGWRGPVSSLYSVAAGFKPNRILQTHGMDAHTRVVFFDYSSKALDVRRTLVEEWDGEDFPGFVRELFRRFPAPDTYYQLWSGARPDAMDWEVFEGLWQREVARLGGAAAFRDHWRRYRTLPHEYLLCDLLADPETVVARIRPEDDAVIWFSNAPFTMHGNWRYPVEQRRARYERFVEGVAAANPGIWLFGSDSDNSNVNGVTAGEYRGRYRDGDPDPLQPRGLYRYELRM